jgi:hypothetical protein
MNPAFGNVLQQPFVHAALPIIVALMPGAWLAGQAVRQVESPISMRRFVRWTVRSKNAHRLSGNPEYAFGPCSAVDTKQQNL